MEINRRDFLKLLGISGVATVAGAWSADALLSVPDDVFERIMSGPRNESFLNSICGMCPGGCGIKVRRIDNIPVRIEGNPFYPINRGAVCPKAEAAITALFHPERIKSPLIREGNRDSHKWQNISWEEALNILAERLIRLRDQTSTEHLAFISRESNSIHTQIIQEFMSAFGSPNYFLTGDMHIFSLPAYLSQGLIDIPAYDLKNADYIINFGGDFLDEEPSPVRFNQIWSDLRNREPGDKVRIIHVGSYMSRTAANSSLWVPVNPGTLSALALGMANVIIRDKTYDREFINNNSFGFHDWQDSEGRNHEGFASMVSSGYYPEKAASITGVPAPLIVKIAREFSAARKPLAISGKQAAQSTNGTYTIWSIYCLNALTGNLNKEGGVLFPEHPFSVRGDIKHPDPGAVNTNGFGFKATSLPHILRILDGDNPVIIDTLIMRAVNPVHEYVPRAKFAELASRIPFIVNCTSFMTETSEFADLILPESSFLESWDISHSIPFTEFNHFGVQQPVIDPLYDTMDIGNIILRLDRHLNPEDKKYFKWSEYREYLQSFAHDIYDSGEGIIVSENVNLSWLQYLKDRGFQAFDYSDYEEFWTHLIQQGGWWMPESSIRKSKDLYKTPSGKFEFFSQKFSREFNNLIQNGEQAEDILQKWHIDAREDLLFMPHYEAPRFMTKEGELPLHLLAYNIWGADWKNDTTIGLLQELSGIYSRQYWNIWAEINPETAHQYGLSEHEDIIVRNGQGSLSLKVLIHPTVMPGVIMIPNIQIQDVRGPGFYAIGEYQTDPLSGAVSGICTRAEIANKKKSDELT